MTARIRVVEGPFAALAARAVQWLAVIVAVVVAGVGAFATSVYLTSALSRTVDILPAADEIPDIGAPAEIPVFYRSVRVILEAPSVQVRWLAWSSAALYGVLVLAGCVIAFLLARRMMKRRISSRTATTGVIAVGALAVLVAVLAPWLDGQATLLGVQELGARVYDPSANIDLSDDARTETLVAPDALFDLRTLLNTEWLLAGVGIVLVLGGIAFRTGKRLQRSCCPRRHPVSATVRLRT